MIIEKISEYKIKIIFYIEELNENNISLHSFLSNSIETQKMLNSILDIASKEFGFNIEKCLIKTDTISFNNQKFIVFVTKEYNNIRKIATETSTSNVTTIYRFENYNDFNSFLNYFNNFIPLVNFKNSLYKYNNKLYLFIDFKDSCYNNKIISIISEYTNNISLSPLAFLKLIEYSELIIKDNAIQKFKGIS